MVTTANLLAKKSMHQVQALNEGQIQEHLAVVAGWNVEDGKICRIFSFQNYYETLAFVNAIAYIIHTEDHHPDLTVTYNRCAVKFNTHSVNGGLGGLSENDFICAAKINAVYAHTFV
ncbi:MAG: 4a-hydroxytetrahydrobiopterin dehydratase [Burkholderiales bacterium]|nr:4a-hydroxytetrahydrobiopterin dehydratase [Burkholderiales bacterium]